MPASHVFFDMDGVLCQFVAGALKAHGGFEIPQPLVEWDFCTQIGFNGHRDPRFWEPLSNPEFWSSLEPHRDGMELLHRTATVLGPSRICILSSGACPGSCDGKRAWLKRHLPEFEKSAVFATEKWRAAAPCKILVDDHGPNCESFVWPPTKAKGGAAVLVPRPWNGLKDHCKPGTWDFDVHAVLQNVLGLALAL